jgi:Tfp pilus assembly protein PilF
MLLLAGCATMEVAEDEDAAQAHYDIGVGALHANDLPRAIGELETAVGQAPRNPRFHYALGNAYLRSRRIDSAVRSLQRAVELDPQYSDAHNALGGAYAQQQKWEQAIESFRRALANPRYLTPEQAHLNLGGVYYSLGRHQLAADQFRKVIDIRPQSPDGYFLLGRTLLAQGRPAEAKEQLLKAVKTADAVAIFHLELGVAHMRLGDKANATAAFRRVVELSPASTEANEARRHLNQLK